MTWSSILKSSSNTLRRSESLYWSLQSYSQAYFSSNWNRYFTASIVVKDEWYRKGWWRARRRKSCKVQRRMLSSWSNGIGRIEGGKGGSGGIGIEGISGVDDSAMNGSINGIDGCKDGEVVPQGGIDGIEKEVVKEVAKEVTKELDGEINPIDNGIRIDPIENIKLKHNVMKVTQPPIQPTSTSTTTADTTTTSTANLKNLIASLSPLEKSFTNITLINLWKSNLINPSTQLNALKLKASIYSYLSLLKHKENLLEPLFSLFHTIPHQYLSSLDYQFYLSLLIQSEEYLMIEVCLKDASERLSKEEFLKLFNDELIKNIPSSSILNIFASTILKYNGTLELLSSRYAVERSILKRVLLHLASLSSSSSSSSSSTASALPSSSSPSPEFPSSLPSTSSPLLCILFDYSISSPYFGSMLLTSCIDILGQPDPPQSDQLHQPDNCELSLQLWDLKLQLNLVTPLDLNRIMACLYHNQKYQQVLDIYDNHQSLHQQWQYDILLLSLAKLKNWERLQSVFESLFKYNNLPDIHHYGIVIQALSQLANIDIVDTLFNSLLERSITPSIEIIHGLMFSRLALGETVGVEYFFNKIADFGLKPNPRSYIILLRSYRDSHDIKNSLLVIGKMAQLNIPISHYAVTTLISTCTERRDSETGQALFDWALSYGIKPDIIMYNSLLACYMESNLVFKAENLYKIMKDNGVIPGIDTLTSLLIGYSRLGKKNGCNRYEENVKVLLSDMKLFNIVPDDKWLSSLMNYYLTIKNFLKVEEIFYNLESKYSIIPSSYHYTILMECYIIQRDFDKAELLYNDMKVKNVTPTFITQEKYLRLKISNPNKSIRLESGGILQEFLNTKDIIDLQSKQLPRNVIPFSMVKKVAREYMKDHNYEAALVFLKPYIDGYDPKEQFKVSAFLLELYGHAGYWALVEKQWEIFMEQVKLVYVPVKQGGEEEKREEKGEGKEQGKGGKEEGEKKEKESVNVKAKHSLIQLLELGGNKHHQPTITPYKKILPPRYQGTFTKQIDAKLNQLHNFSKYSEMINFLTYCYHQGFGISSKNINTLIRALLQDDDHIIKGFEIADKYLTPSMLSKISQTNEKHKYYLSKQTLKSLMKNFNQLIAIIAYNNKCSRIKAFLLFKEKYPNLMTIFTHKEKDKFVRNVK